MSDRIPFLEQRISTLRKQKDRYKKRIAELEAYTKRLELRISEFKSGRGNVLPKITEEIYCNYRDTDLITICTGLPDWSQVAVDFACLLDEIPSAPGVQGEPTIM